MVERNSFLSDDELRSSEFASLGSNVKISRFAKFYGSNFLSIGNNVRIDDFTVISLGTISRIGDFVHVSAQSSIYAAEGIDVGDFVTISGRVGIYGQSDDYSGAWLTNPTIPEELRFVEQSRVSIGAHAIIGSNSTILPGAQVAEGVAIGAHTLLTHATDPWGIYVGTPAKRIKERERGLLGLKLSLSEYKDRYSH